MARKAKPSHTIETEAGRALIVLNPARLVVSGWEDEPGALDALHTTALKRARRLAGNAQGGAHAKTTLSDDQIKLLVAIVQEAMAKNPSHYATLTRTLWAAAFTPRVAPSITPNDIRRARKII